MARISCRNLKVQTTAAPATATRIATKALAGTLPGGSSDIVRWRSSSEAAARSSG